MPRKKEGRHTYGDYLTWPDGERWELIDGVAYDMTPAPTRSHQKLVVELVRQLAVQLKGHACELYAAPFDVRLGEGKEDDDLAVETVVQPDVIVVCDAKRLDERGCRGAPDFVVDVVSPSSVSRDSIKKVALYERHGVREYWIVHPGDRLVYVRRLQASGRFAATDVREAAETVAVSAVPGLTVDLGELFAVLE